MQSIIIVEKYPSFCLIQAWKRYKQSFVIKKKKDGGKFDSNKRDSTMNPRLLEKIVQNV